MKKLSSYRYVLRAALASLLAVCSWSCVFDRDSACPDASRNGIVLNLHVVTQGPVTRSGGHELVAGTTAENYLNVARPDFAVLIFDGDGRLTENLPFASSVLITDDSSDYSVYSLSGRITTESDEIQIMVLANWGSFSGRYGVGINQMLQTLYTDGQKWNFTMPAVAGNTSWTPYFDEKNPENSRTIPMFGISEKISLAQLKNREDRTIRLVEGGDYPPVYMLRSVAKIEVIDNLQQELIEMTGCSLTAYNTVGRYIPDVLRNGEWNVAATQVTTPSLPTDPGFRTAGSAGATALDFVRTTNSAGQNVFVAYIPEMLIGTVRPQVEVHISMPTISGQTEVRTYPFSLDNYVNGQAGGSLGAVLRNHIYSYTITKTLTSGEITVDYTVCPWAESDTDITFN